MDPKIDPGTGDYCGERVTTLANAVYLRLTTPLGSWWADPALGSRLHELERERDVARVYVLARQYAEQALAPLLPERARRIAASPHRRIGRQAAPRLVRSAHRGGGCDRPAAALQAPCEGGVMAFIIPGLAQIRTALLRDLKNSLPDADVTPDSDFYVRATSVASAVEGLYQHQSWIVRQIFPDTADQEYLYMHAAVRGLSLKRAVPARGYLRIRGQAGALVPEGLLAKRADGVLYRVTANAAMPEAGEALCQAEAAAPGQAGNAADNNAVTVQAAPVGLEASANVQSMRGGVDQEADSELLARLLELIRRPPAGGNRHDYSRWAMEVDGVTEAFAYPLRRGLGTIDVAIVSGDGLPSRDTISRVQAHIDDVRPVTAKSFLVVAPTLRPVDLVVYAELQGTSIDAASAAIKHALATQFAHIAPGTAWIRSQAEALVSNVPGVVDREIVAPETNVQPVINANVIEWLRMGTVTVGPFTKMAVAL